MIANRKYVLISASIAVVTLLASIQAVVRTNAAEAIEDRMIQSRLDSFPVTVALTWQGPDSPRRRSVWFLSVNSAGEGEMTSYFDPDEKKVAFNVPHKLRANFRATLKKERFFGLKDKHGDIAVHGTSVFITIVAGEFTKSVEIQDLRLRLAEGDAKNIDEGARAVRSVIAAAELYDEKLATSLKGHFAYLLR